ncbi:GAP1-N1 domain-containing protein [Pseudomonas sp. OV226]|uniref:GAP1-N1 domain-containing protein n=1 Tax=Pseudomonas sp. OV226 TaxID=2135588 RepID=UPI000D6DA2A4|nr:hypothetical protein [Pseudomonas sp. OV226]PWK39034.1 hypothetical protein C7534_1149 [Pseudomonas sp. OV226]
MKFDQCLFGYDDGHRLLASSLPLGSETSLLTELSDLAPGTIFNQSEGYWTGLPLPAIGRYVLMRTWPAPEMSRPGCVWTHALLLEPALLESIEDLSVLQDFAIRPFGLADKERYREPLTVDVSHLVHQPELVDNAVVKRLLLALYAAGTTSVEVDSPGQLDAPLFAVWSQQWPRLRRNLRFQTAASRAPRSTGSIRFDVTAELAQTSAALSGISVKGEPWLVAAALDVQEGVAGALRPFLWRYGRDVRRQRGSFLPLVEIRDIDIGGGHDSGKRLIEIVTESFSASDDAKSLKQDLVDGNLASIAQPQLLRSVLSGTGNTVFPMPTHSGVSKLADLWPERREEMISLVEITVDAADPMGKSVFDLLTGGPKESLAWLLVHASSHARKRIAKASPELLLADWVLDLESSALVELLPLIPDKLAGVDALLAKLLTRNDDALAKVAFEHFSVVTAGQIILATGAGRRVADAWRHTLMQRPAVILQPEVWRFVSCTSQLYAMAEFLGWLTPNVIAAGPELWTSTLRNALNDLPAEKSDTLYCFLIAIALSSGDSRGIDIVEKLFDVIHDQLLRSQLSDTAREKLGNLLPDIGWFRGWDIALRFRLAIANAYVRFQWPTQSYAKLSATRKGRVMLADAASDVPGGKRYAKAADF